MLRFLARSLGLWLMAGALIALVVDGSKSIATSRIVTTPLGKLWFSVDPASLNIAQAVVQRYVHPVLWDPVIVTILLAPTFVVLGVVGTLLLLAGQKKRIPEAELDAR